MNLHSEPKRLYEKILSKKILWPFKNYFSQVYIGTKAKCIFIVRICSLFYFIFLVPKQSCVLRGAFIHAVMYTRLYTFWKEEWREKREREREKRDGGRDKQSRKVDAQLWWKFADKFVARYSDKSEIEAKRDVYSWKNLGYIKEKYCYDKRKWQSLSGLHAFWNIRSFFI